MVAAAEGGWPAVAALVRLGADVNARDWAGMTPLMLAACQSAETLPKLQTLLESGASVQARSNDGYTALDCALNSGSSAFGRGEQRERRAMG